MRTFIFTAILLCGVPALAADPVPAPAAPPSPTPVGYEVWGFRWDGQQYVQDATRSFATNDLKQAADYVNQLNGYAGWSAATNVPESAFVHTVYHGPGIVDARPTSSPASPSFSVWAFRLTDGKWMKDDKYSWTTSDSLAALEYANNVAAVHGWTATTNSPAVVPAAQRYVDGGAVQGTLRYATNSYRGNGRSNMLTINGRTISLPPMMMPYMGLIQQAMQNGNWSDGSGSYDSSASFDNSSSDDNSQAIQDSINTQNMIDNQDMLNNQQMQNNIQDMINTQNAVNTQNMIDAQNAANAQMNNP